MLIDQQVVAAGSPLRTGNILLPYGECKRWDRPQLA
jgi:hypothetical protein